MIVLGIAPGLKSLAYSVLDISKGYARCVDHDVLLGGRIKNLNSLAEFAKKAYVHALILDVVFERDPPIALAIGPACNPKDPELHLSAVTLMLKTLANKFGVQVLPVDAALMDQILTPSPRESLLRVVNRRLTAPLDSDDRRQVLATAVALVGSVVLHEARAHDR